MELALLEKGCARFSEAFKQDFRGAVEHARLRLQAAQRGEYPSKWGQASKEGTGTSFDAVWSEFEQTGFAMAEAYRAGDEAVREQIRLLIDQHKPVGVGLMHIIEWTLPQIYHRQFPQNRVQYLFDFFALLGEPFDQRLFTRTLSNLWDVCRRNEWDPRSYHAAAVAIAHSDYVPVLAAFKPVDTSVWPG